MKSIFLFYIGSMVIFFILLEFILPVYDEYGDLAKKAFHFKWEE